MDFRGFKFNITLRLAAILVTMFILAYLIWDQAYFLTVIFFLIVLGLQVISLYRVIDKSREDFMTFLAPATNPTLITFATPIKFLSGTRISGKVNSAADAQWSIYGWEE